MKDYVFDLYVQLENVSRIYVTAKNPKDAWIRAAEIAGKTFGIQLDKIELIAIMKENTFKG